MSQLSFTMPDGSIESVDVTALLNAGYAGRNQAEVASHIAELAALGVPAPTTTPALYPISPYLAQQTDRVYVQHGRTSGEAEWALIITDDDVLITAACDHTDRDLEVHSVAWSKNAAPRRTRYQGMAAFGHCRPTRRRRTRGVGRPRRHHRADPARYARRSPRAQVLARRAHRAWRRAPWHRVDFRDDLNAARCQPVCGHLEGCDD